MSFNLKDEILKLNSTAPILQDPENDFDDGKNKKQTGSQWKILNA